MGATSKLDFSVSIFRDSPAEGWLSMDRYARELTAALRRSGDCPDLVDLEPPPPLSGGRGLLLSRMVHYPLWARKQGGDVNHILDHSYGHLLYTLDPRKSVVTVHDIAPVLFPGHRFGLSGLMWRIAMSGALRAARMITDSEFTRQQVIERYDYPPEKIEKIYLGVDPGFRPLSNEELQSFLQKYVLPDQSLVLHAGKTHARKNFGRLIEAVGALHQVGERIHLVQLGGYPSEDQARLIEALHLGGFVHFLGKVPERDLVGFYNAADLFVFPSVYEGFGFPPLEAMACGTPVIAADAASLPEVVGAAGVLVPPEDTTALADAVQTLLNNRAMAEQYSELGLTRAAGFTWEKTASKTIEVYAGIAS